MKETLITYLKTKHIDGVVGLWFEAKAYYQGKLIEMGGGYASFGKHISIILNIDGEITRFKVNLDEIK